MSAPGNVPPPRAGGGYTFRCKCSSECIPVYIPDTVVVIGSFLGIGCEIIAAMCIAPITGVMAMDA